MADNLELAIRIRADLEAAVQEIKKLRKQIDKTGDGGKKAEDGLNRAAKAAERMDKSSKSLGKSLRTVQGLFVALGAATLVRELIQATDSFKQMQGQLRLVTNSEAELVTVQNELFQVAQSTRSAWQPTVELYARVARNSESLGLSQQQLLDITKATNQAIQISGATASEASAGVVQFAQALASGELRGDELRSVLENMPRLAKAIADGLGTTIGGLRDLAEDGELTADRVTQALLSQGAVIDSEFSKLPRTVGQATQQLQNELQRVVSETDMTPLVDSLDDLRDILTDPAVVEGIKTLAAGAINAIGQVLRFSAEIANAAADLGRVAALSFGDLDKLTELEAKIEQLQSAKGASLFTRTRLFGEKGAIHVWTDEEIEEEIKRLEGQRQQIIEAAGQVYAPIGGDADQDTPTSAPAPKPTALIPAGSDKESEKAQAALEKLQATLREQVETFGKADAEVLRYRLTVGDLSDEVAKLGARGQELAASIVAQADRLDALNEKKRQEAEADREREKAEQEALKARQKLESEGQSLTESLRTPQEEYNAALQDYQRLLDAGVISQETFNRAVAASKDTLEKATSDTSEFATQAARNIQDALGQEALNLMEGKWESFGDAVVNVIQKIAAEAAAAELAKALFGDYGKDGETSFGGLIGTALNAFVQHDGGPAGTGPRRAVNPMLFMNAPRLHNGLRPDEFPAILQKGEEVLAKDSPRNSKNGGESQSLNIVFNNEVLDGSDFVDRVAPQSEKMAIMISQASQQYNLSGA